MELFVFMRMGGKREDVIIKLLDESADLPRMFSRFDAGAARCFLEGDRQHLLAVIETGFGNFAPFNKVVRGIFADKLEGKPVTANKPTGGPKKYQIAPAES